MKAIIKITVGDESGKIYEYTQKANATGAGIRNSKNKNQYKKLLGGALYEITDQEYDATNNIHYGRAAKILSDKKAIQKKLVTYNTPKNGAKNKITIVFDGKNSYIIDSATIVKCLRDSEKNGHQIAVIDIQKVRELGKKINLVTQKEIDLEAETNAKCKHNKGRAYEILLKRKLLNEKNPDVSPKNKPDLIYKDTEVEVKYNAKGVNSNTIIRLD